jgi:type IV pilus assembly protein PilV
MSRRSRGYTIVELMMALAILAIGVTGIIAMHKVTVASNQHAKNLAIATHVAQAWQEQLAADAATWNQPSRLQTNSDIGQTTWLQAVAGGGGWARPVYSAALAFGPSFDALGNPVTEGDVDQAHFCTHLRLTWLYSDSEPAPGNGLIRAEVRVFWLREGRPAEGGASVCNLAADPTAIGANLQDYHFVYKTSAVRQNTAP